MNNVMFEAFQDELNKIAAQYFKPTKGPKAPTQEAKIKAFKDAPAQGQFRGMDVSRGTAREIVTKGRMAPSAPIPSGAHKVTPARKVKIKI